MSKSTLDEKSVFTIASVIENFEDELSRLNNDYDFTIMSEVEALELSEDELEEYCEEISMIEKSVTDIEMQLISLRKIVSGQNRE